jgi:hypothetical protein
MVRPIAAMLALGIAAAASLTSLLSAQVAKAPRTDALNQVRSVSTALVGDRVSLTPTQIEDAEKSGLWPAGIRSLLNIRKPLTYGAYVWNEWSVSHGELSIRVDLRTQIISVFRAGHEIGTAVILYGADSHRTPEGTFPILERVRDHQSRTYDAPMPYALRLTTDGVAIHGSKVRVGAATHGCIGVPLEFARRVFDEASVGDKVLIVRSSAANA